jgi:hypothetical protein
MTAQRLSHGAGHRGHRTDGSPADDGISDEVVDYGVRFLAARDAVVGLEAEVGVLRSRIVDLEDQLAAVLGDNRVLAAQAEAQLARADELEITSRHFHTLAWSAPGRVARVLFRPFRRFVVD